MIFQSTLPWLMNLRIQYIINGQSIISPLPQLLTSLLISGSFQLKGVYHFSGPPLLRVFVTGLLESFFLIQLPYFKHSMLFPY